MSKGSKKRRAAAIAPAQKERREDKAHDVKPPTESPAQPVIPASQLTTPPAPAPESPAPVPPAPEHKQPAVPTPPTDAADWWKRLSAAWTNLGGVGFLALVVGIVGIAYTHRTTEINADALKELQRQNDLTERNQKRLTGEIAAKMQLAWSSPQREQFSKDMRTKAFGLDDVPYFKSLPAFLLLPPTVRLNNVGDEPIEAIRLVTSCSSADLDKGIEPKSTILLRSEEREEIALPQLWLPGTAIEISLVKNLVAQMAHIQMKQPQDVLHRAFFETRIYGKIAGSTVYANSENKMVLTWVVWLPSGFPDNKCREVHDGLRTKINFGPKQPVTMVTGTDMADVAQQLKAKHDAKNEGRPK